MININDLLTEEARDSLIDFKIEKKDFPLHVLPEAYQFLLKELKLTNNYAIDYTATALFSVYSLINGNRIKLKIKSTWISPSLFWFAIVGSPGTQKTHPLKFILKPISDLNQQLKDEYDIKNFEYEKLSDKEKKNEIKPQFNQLIINDSTIEAIHKAHTFSKNGLLLYRDELKGWFNSMNNYKNGKGSDEQFWLESFNNGEAIVNRVTREVMTVSECMINIIGTIQPNVLADFTNTDNGFIDRFLFTKDDEFCHYLPEKDFDEKYIKIYQNAIKDFFYKIYPNDNMTMILEMEEEALEEFYIIDKIITDNQNNAQTTARQKGYWSKIKTYLPRFALVLWLIDLSLDYNEGDKLQAKYITNAWELCEYYYNNALIIFNEQKEVSEAKACVSKESNVKAKIIKLLKEGTKSNTIAKTLDVTEAYVSRIKKTIK